jgi:hypothetical protein
VSTDAFAWRGRRRTRRALLLADVRQACYRQVRARLSLGMSGGPLTSRSLADGLQAVQGADVAARGEQEGVTVFG